MMPQSDSNTSGEVIHSRVLIQLENEFDFQSSEFRQLFENSDATAFQNPIWLRELYEKLAPSRGAKAVVITGRIPETQELAFVLPMTMRRLNGIRLLESADLGVSDYSSPIVNRTMVDMVKQEQLHSSIDDVIGNYDVLRLKPIREQTVNLWSLFFSGNYQQLDFSSHEMPIGSSFEEWREATYAPSFRKEVDRKLRKFNRDVDLKFEILTCEDAANAVKDIQQLRAGRFDGDPIQQDFVLSFYQQVARRGCDQGIAHVHKLSADGELVGALFGLSRNGVHHGILMGSNYDRFGKYSPTMLMVDQLLRDWHESGGIITDFNIGDEPFKRRFGAKPVNLYQLCKPKGPIGWIAKKVLEFQNR